MDRLQFEAFQLLEEIAVEPPPEGSEGPIRKQLLDADYGFVAWERAGAKTRVIAVDDGPGEPEGSPTPGDWAALRAGTVPEGEIGRTLRFFERPSGPGAFGRAIGLQVSAELVDAVRSAADDHGRYLQLAIYKEVQKKWVWFSSGLVFLLAAATATLVAIVTARHISRPVTGLARAADRVAAGDLTVRAEVPGHGQIGDLVDAFNRMTTQLRRSREELVRVERIAAWRDVARRIAHEIRNPLTPVKLAIHRLKARLPDDEVSQACLRSIDEEVESLNRISESFSEFAKMPEPRFAPTDLAQIARSVVSLFEGSREGVAILYEGPEELPVVADRDHLRRASTNLVKNASEALSGGGTIRVRVGENRGRAVLEVSDDGPGIPAAIRDTLFRPGVSARPGGSGLGLSMVHRVATDHKGALKSKNQDRGACFVLEIPLGLKESR